MSIVEFAFGFLIGFASHELGHQVAATATGTKNWWEWRGEPAMVILERRGYATSRHSNAIGVAGFVSNQITVEASMFGKRTNLKKGIIFQGAINPVGYIVRHEIKPYGDLKRLEAGGYKKKYMYPVLTAVSVLNFYRLFNNNDVPVNVGLNHVSLTMRF